MQEELKLLENDSWLSHYDLALADGWTTIPLVSHDGSARDEKSQYLGKWGEYKETSYLEKLPYFKEVLRAFKCPHGRIRIMKLMPGTIIKTHRDTFDEVSDVAFGQVRLHIPVITNDKVIFTVGSQNYKLKAGRLYYVNFSKKHYVRNDGTEARTHLVLDLQCNDFLHSVFPPASLFQRFEMLVTRTFLPIFLWIPLRMHSRAWDGFWRLYKGSVLQKFRHRFFPKRQPV
jgi:hypothetical protein